MFGLLLHERYVVSWWLTDEGLKSRTSDFRIVIWILMFNLGLWGVKYKQTGYLCQLELEIADESWFCCDRVLPNFD
jgi:hypothetical protein